MDIEQIARERLGEKFHFRKGQLEIVEDIITTYKAGKTDLYLLDAPTGSGKSIIAMLAAEALNREQHRGYILASDLSLVDQYSKDFDKHFPHFGEVKGLDNYNCHVNNEKFSIGECRIKGMSYEAAGELPCAPMCGYLVNRKKAMRASTTLTTYSYWLIQQNYVNMKAAQRGTEAPFGPRDFTFCDEAHKTVEIVQNHFSPRIDATTFEKLEKFRQFLKKHSLALPRTSSMELSLLVERLKRSDGNELRGSLKEFEMVLGEFLSCGESVRGRIATMFPGEARVPGDWRYAMGLDDWTKDMHCKFQDYNNFIHNETMIKNPQGNQGAVIFNCLDENYLMTRHFHSQAKFKLMMTATLGDPNAFIKMVAGKNARYKRMESNFNFEKSPIYFYSGKRMSYKEREKSLPWAADKISEILGKHDENGIIHSGSYEMTATIMDMLPEKDRERIIVYQGTKEKEQGLQRFIAEKGTVLMGPSILEGLDLFQDRSRFQIFVKVPFPHLGDKFVAAKLKSNQEWYDWKAIISILQGIGRSVRSEEDWAVTYFLDDCLGDLLKRMRRAFPPEVLNRIKTVSQA
jgi:ATP-dependent DNA helicase DinG